MIKPWKSTTVKIYPEINNSIPIVFSVGKERLKGFSGDNVAEFEAIDIYGNTTVRSTSINRGQKTRSESILYPDSAVVELTEKINGLRTMERTKDDLSTTYSYDGLARLMGVNKPRIGTSTLTYYTVWGKKGLPASVTDAAGNSSEFDYSETGRLAWVKNALSKYTRYVYNDFGQVTRIWGDTQYPLEFTYDTLGQQTGMKTYRIGSDWNSVLWPENAPTGDLTTWMYDPASGLVTSKVDAALKAVNYTYTVDGKLATRTWARGIVTNYGYDPATGKLLTVDYADATPDITYTYNRLGQLATVADAAGTHTFSYDAALNRIGEAIAGIYSKNLNYTYANTGVKGRYTGFSLDNLSNSVYSYDSYGRLNQIDGLGGSFTYSRLADSELIENLTRPNGVNTQWGYEAHRNLVTQVTNGAVSTFGYVNDAIGLRTSMSRIGSAFAVPDVLSYGYNDRNEVTSAVSNNNASYNYSYGFDPIGNRLTANLAGTSFQYTANALNQYTAVNADAPTYDFDGNMLTNGAWSYTWNGENRMIAAVNGNTRLEFAYDYMGRRVEKKVYDGETLSKHTKFVYNGFKLIEELDALDSNATLRKYTWQPEELGLDVPLSVYDATLDTTYFYATDANKNVSELTDGTGAVVAHYEYSPFGTQTATTGAYAATNPFRFSSEYYDAETGLVYYNYRFYSPEIGRWTSRDPIEEEGGWNLYVMVENDLLNCIDLLGLIVTGPGEVIPWGGPDGADVFAAYFNGGGEAVAKLAEQHATGLIDQANAGEMGIALRNYDAARARGESRGEAAVYAIAMTLPGVGIAEALSGIALKDPCELGRELSPLERVIRGASSAYDVAALAFGAAKLSAPGRGAIAAKGASAGASAATKNAAKQVGSYTIDYNGIKYHGKGPLNRMEQSIKERFPNVPRDHVQTDWTPAANDMDAFVQEALRINADGGIGNPRLLNEINSPGKKILENLGIYVK